VEGLDLYRLSLIILWGMLAISPPARAEVFRDLNVRRFKTANYAKANTVPLHSHLTSLIDKILSISRHQMIQITA